ncbi:MAG: alpha/beta hydrolase [Spirochaeta sp.]
MTAVSRVLGRIIATALCLAAVGCSYSPLEQYLHPAGVRIQETSEYIEMTPTVGDIADTGLMFWPGGLVDPHSYRGSLGVLAARGYRVVILKVPFDLAVFGRRKGLDVAGQLGGTWAAAGHSLGGAMAASILHDNPDSFTALILMAAYPPEDKSLSGWSGPVLSIYAANDGLVDPATIRRKMPLLPDHTLYRLIEGGNHAQFGAYGKQDDDGTAGISPAAQHAIMAELIDAFLSSVASS